MTGVRILLVKEMREQARSHRLLAVFAVFLLFGLGSPLTAKLTPELIRLVGTGTGFSISMPAPTAADAVAQYVKNVSQIVLLVVVLLASSSVVAEKEKGTAAFLLVKPVSRAALLAAKLLAHGSTATAALLLSAAGCWLYTVLLFGSLPLLPFVVSSLLLLVHVLTFVATTILCSAIAGSQAAAAILSFRAWVLPASLGMLGRVSDFLPGRLLLLALAPPGVSTVWEPLLGSVVLAAASLVGAWLALRSWEP